LQIGYTIVGGGKTINTTTTRDDEVAIVADYTSANAIAAAKTGSLTTRTNNTEGTITLTAGHGLSTSTVDIYWATGMRYGVSATITVNACAITGGSGDNLPAQDTAVFVCTQTEKDIDFDGDALTGLVIYASARASVDFQTSGGTSGLHVELTAGEPYIFVDGTTPITGDPIDKAMITAGTAANTDVVIWALHP
jgi:hypothetical protein